MTIVESNMKKISSREEFFPIIFAYNCRLNAISHYFMLQIKLKYSISFNSSLSLPDNKITDTKTVMRFIVFSNLFQMKL